jgi:hypothetical protein
MTKLRYLCLALALVACKGKKADTTPKNTGGDTSKMDATLCESSGKREATYDLNKDGKPDIWRLYKGETLSCKEIDFDHDGKKDWLVAYDGSGKIVYQKADFDFDGKFDMAAVFDPATGHRQEVERDTDFDGKFDIKEIYAADGNLQSVRRDRNGDNLPDQWDQYVDGVLTATTYDDNFDGKVDRREDAPPGGAPKPPTPLEPTAPPPPTSGSGAGSASASK